MALVLASSSTSTLAFSRQSGFASRNSFAKTDYNNRVLRFPVKRNPTLTCFRAQSDDSTTTSDHDTMKNKKHKDEGVFAATVVVLRNIIGKKRFNQLRGKAIALHSQVITDFCNYIGADSKQRQGLIRLAKKNGEKLGFLA